MREVLAPREFREMNELEKVIAEFGDGARAKVVNEVSYKGRRFPLYSVEIGSTKPQDPVVAYFGGVHGLEKIGTEVLLSYMRTLLELSRWDESFNERLKRSRILFMPIVNPVGILLRRRANGRGVDLMRNSPADGVDGGFARIYSGHRISPKLPWYRGRQGEEMEIEAQALCQVVEESLFPSRLSFAVDVHSGFGAMDRFWFPYAKTLEPFPFLPEVYAFKTRLDRTYPHHFYVVEPVSRQYTIHGDLWDYLFDRFYEQNQSPRFFPWTLEMGSWMWLRKNPLQIFKRYGVFHPIQPHRHQRILRRHLTLFDFIHRSLLSASDWMDQNQEVRERNHRLAMELWYGQS